MRNSIHVDTRGGPRRSKAWTDSGNASAVIGIHTHALVKNLLQTVHWTVERMAPTVRKAAIVGREIG